MNENRGREKEEAAAEFSGKFMENRQGKNEDVMVTVICVTYNHEKYIAQALDSFLMQKTNFKYKIFVGEDHGQDGTADIIRQYAAKYPEIIVPFIREKNLGPQRNGIDMCQKATSPYIAFCDGDDYWIDEYKLQKQFDYMEAHQDYRFCFARTEILSTENWPHRLYYKANAQGKYIIPDCYPNFSLCPPPLEMADFIKVAIGHTSTLFFRWDYDLEFPQWFFEGILGDLALKLMQMKDGKAGYIDDIVSVYRVNETGVFTSYKDNDEMFVNTRIEFVRCYSGLLQWYEDNKIPDYPKTLIENRLIREINNLFSSALRIDDYENILKLFTRYPEAAKLALGFYVSANRDRRLLEECWGWPGFQAVVRNKYFRNLLSPYARFAAFLLKLKRSSFYRTLRNKCKNLLSWICYWLFALIPKKKNLWIVSGFRKNTYMDNTRYFYEYTVRNHPEIEIYWATLNQGIYNQLRAKGYPVLKMRTLSCAFKIARASIAVVDHYAVSDFERPSGFNSRTKVVQLWHGAGFKTAVSRDGNTTAGEPGVVPSADILPSPGDSLFVRLKKGFLYIRHAYYRELYENYFLFLTPGQEMIDRMARPWGIPETSYFTSGYPRLEPIFHTSVDKGKFNILYAPTYRWDPQEEKKVVQGFLDACSVIQDAMNDINGFFTLRLHPHTWRNYRPEIIKILRVYDRINFDSDKDLYHTLGTYEIVITDYSSTAVDFAVLGRPTIYYCPDYEEYSITDTGLIKDFKERITGPFTESWEETLDEVKKYCANPLRDVKTTKEKCGYFYNCETTDERNSERIICEIERRLGILKP